MSLDDRAAAAGKAAQQAAKVRSDANRDRLVDRAAVLMARWSDTMRASITIETDLGYIQLRDEGLVFFNFEADGIYFFASVTDSGLEVKLRTRRPCKESYLVNITSVEVLGRQLRELKDYL